MFAADPRPHRSAHWIVPPLVLLLLLTACARSTSGAGGAPGCDRSVVLGDKAKGTTVHACVGETIRLELASTYWQDVRSSDPSVLGAAGSASVTPASPGTCVPGGGCGTVEQRFTAKAAGISTVTAHRTSCGEALACQGDLGSFSVRVVVS